MLGSQDGVYLDRLDNTVFVRGIKCVPWYPSRASGTRAPTPTPRSSVVFGVAISGVVSRAGVGGPVLQVLATNAKRH